MTQYEYDGVGRISKVLDAFGNSTQILYEDQYVNQLGQNVLKRIQIDALGNCKEEIFDTQDNLVKVIKKDKNGQVLQTQNLFMMPTETRLLSKMLCSLMGSVCEPILLLGDYDQGDRLTSIHRAAASPDERTTAFSYNSWGDLSLKHSWSERTDHLRLQR